jgi:hypothetical protein
MSNTVLIGTPRITTPNLVGKVIRETPKMFIVLITGKDFTAKSGKNFTHVFSKSEQKWFMENFKPYEKKFWKKNHLEVGGDAWIVYK